MRHDLVTLELVLLVARAKSITGGAARANMALAAASKRISDFETRLGMRLFRRTGRGVDATEECQCLLQHIASVRQALDRLDQDVARFSRTINGTIRIALTAEAIACGAAEELAGFGLAHPHVRYVIEEVGTAEALQSVATHDADLAIALQPEESCGLALRPYASGRWNVLLPVDHPLAPTEVRVPKEIQLAEVEPADVIQFPEGLAWRGLMGSGARNSRARTRSAETIFAMVESGLGLAIVTDDLAERATMTHAVKRCELTALPYRLTLATVPEESQSFALRNLLKFVSGRDSSSARYGVMASGLHRP